LIKDFAWDGAVLSFPFLMILFGLLQTLSFLKMSNKWFKDLLLLSDDYYYIDSF